MIIFRAVEKGMEVSDVLDAEGLKALDEAVKAEDKTDEANADTETAGICYCRSCNWTIQII